ncbi:hypothetical protein X975_09299, partial [Stegodyphus mimosarum]
MENVILSDSVMKDTEPEIKMDADTHREDLSGKYDIKMEDLSSPEMENAAKEKDCKMQAVLSTQIDCDAQKTDTRNKEPSVVSTKCKVQENGVNSQSKHTVKGENYKISEEVKGFSSAGEYPNKIEEERKENSSSTGVFHVKIKEEDDSFPAGEYHIKVEEEDVIMEEPPEVKPECSKEEAACPKENVEIETKASIQEAVCSEEKAECSQVTQRVRLSIEDDSEDDDEEYVIMTPEEVRNFLLQKVNEYMKDPEKNPILNLKQQAVDLETKIKRKNEEFEKLSKFFEHMYHDQEKFLRHIGVLPKIPTEDFGAQVDMPPLPNALSSIPRECLTKMSGAIAKAEATLPPVAPSSIKSQVPPNLLTAPPSRPVPPPKPVVPPPKPAQDNKEIECIDLTDDSDPPSASNSTSAGAATATATTTTAAAAPKFKSPVPISSSTTPSVPSPLRHPAPLPVWPVETHNKTSEPPPKPRLKISAEKQGIILQWDMTLNSNQAKISSYEIFGYQELKQMPITSSLWVKIGLVQAMSLPMACTLTQFQEGHTYHFSIRAVDVNGHCGAYSDPATIVFSPQPALKNIKV